MTSPVQPPVKDPTRSDLSDRPPDLVDVARSRDGDPTTGISVLVAGAVFMSTGAALVAHILLGVPAPLVLAGLVVAAGLAIVVLDRDAPVGWWLRYRRVLVIGLVAGVVSTAAYDLSRWILVLAADMPSSPYAAFPFFGRAIVGQGAPQSLAQWVGTAFHFVNGITFATAYTIWFGRRSWWVGILFGLGLEAVMLAVYPGWLDVKAIAEFTQISLLGHVAYGTVLGLLVTRMSR